MRTPFNHNGPARRGLIVVWGYLAARPFGGMTWQVLHYLEGFKRLGFDVWYVEDSDNKVLRPSDWWPTTDYEDNVAFVQRYMQRIGLADRWVFRPSSQSDRCYGSLSADTLQQLYRDADIVVNLCGSHKLRADHDVIRCPVYLETDPVEIQLGIANGNKPLVDYLDRYTHHFTYGENFGNADCKVPIVRYNWIPTRPPVCVDWWSSASGMEVEKKFTTVANWKNRVDGVVWNNRAYHWRKDYEFQKMLDIPAEIPWEMELALVGIDADQQQLVRDHGWKILSAETLSEPDRYRQYICSSAAEFTVAKEQYAALRSGWFSDRSACYLAAGRPVVMQDTAFGNTIPTGQGLFAFSTKEEAVRAVQSIISDYEGHSRAALEIAREYFAADRVIGNLLTRIGMM